MSLPVNLCIPVLRRYDLLRELLLSLRSSSLLPDVICIIDNGRNAQALIQAFEGMNWKTDIFIPDVPMGVAESWNWFITHLPEERIIVNDDVTFAPQSLERMVLTKGDLVSGLSHVSAAFSCFIIRDSCIAKIGFFDDTISPGYAYFEDCDYEQRMYDLGMRIVPVDAGILHGHSKTLEVASSAERDAHNHKFMIAQRNYIKKWGGLPRGMEEQRV